MSIDLRAFVKAYDVRGTVPDQLNVDVVWALGAAFAEVPGFRAFAAGAAARGVRIAIGTAVIGGMTTATILAIFYVPLFFLTIARLFGNDKPKDEPQPPFPDAGVPA